ncbi:Cyanovirin-N [Roridomyces roridus]|uniref:Cyanovirin-N n=1 Tax=Roridomyces roridus TaxID=1738132 RepID=A0AAD7FFP6_9AGAR|nr:Cyanovirin-N [Roridomyces roridus]
MKAVLSSVILAVCVTVALAGPIEKRAAAVNNFSATCTDIAVDVGTLELTATCQDSAGVPAAPSSIDLNACITNTNGELAAGSDFDATCQDVAFSGVELSAECSTQGDLSVISTSIDLNVVIANQDGVLACV